MYVFVCVHAREFSSAELYYYIEKNETNIIPTIFYF